MVAAIMATAVVAACADMGVKTRRPDIIATNAFYYYADVDAAWVKKDSNSIGA